MNKETTKIYGDFYLASSDDPAIYGTGKMTIEGDLDVLGNLNISINHSSLSNLLNDDHTQYLLLSGRNTGQTVIGGISASDNLTITSTSNATKGSIIFPETTISTSSSTGSLKIAGGISISNTTDSVNSTNGGTFTTAGGLAVAKKGYFGGLLTAENGFTSIVGTTTLGASTIGAITGTSATFSTTLGVTGVVTLNNLTTSQAVFTDASKNLISVATTGTGNVVLATSPTLVTPNIGVATATSINTGAITGTSATFSTTLGVSGISTLGTTTAATISSSGVLTINNTTASTSTTTGSVIIAGGVGITGALFASSGNFTTLTAPHSGLTGLSNDDHSQYALLVGRSGGQILTGGTAASNNLTIRSTSNATKGRILIDETTTSTSNSTGAIVISGGVGISNTTDAVSSTNGGTITTAGGAAIAKKLFVGTDLSVSGISTLGATNSMTVSSTGAVNIASTLGVTGLGTFSGGLTSTAGTTTLGATTIGAITGTSATFSTTLGVSGISTLGTTTAASISSAGVLTINNTTASTSTTTGSVIIAGGVGIAGALFASSGNFTTLTAPHSGLTGLSNDDHTQYALLAGRTGGQILTGGTAASNNLTIRSTSNATKGRILIDETTTSTSNSTGSIVISGGVGISNTTDAVSSTNGGTITTAGGVAIAKKLFVGTDLLVGGTTLLSNYFQTVNITTPSNPPASNIRFYTDTTDSLLKSINSSGTVTTYQPTTTKGDLLSHNGTTQVRLPVGANNAYLVADSAETSGLKWQTIVPGSRNIYYIYDQKTTGTDGGSATSGSWLQRTLNTIDAYPTGTTRVTLSSNTFIMTAGVYKIISLSPFSINNTNIATRIFNLTNNTTVLTSLSGRTDNSDNGVFHSYIYGIINISVTTTFELEYFVSNSRATYGLGRASGLQDEKFSHIEIEVLQ